MCPKSELCRLCLCSSTEVKELVNENGQYNDIYEITAKYFDLMLLTTVICVDCWQHIHEFYEFQQSVFKAQEKLEYVEKNTPIVKLEMVLVDQDENDKKKCENYIIKENNYNIGEENENPLLFDSFEPTDYKQFSFDDEMPLAENSSQYISIEEENISIKEENVSIKEENIEPVPHDTLNEDEYKFKCTFCGRAFKFVSDLCDHTTMHTGEDFYQCPFCTTKCTLYRNIRSHIQNLHPKEYVELGYHEHGALNNLYINLNEKPIQSDDDESKFKCPYCTKKVSNEKNLRRHIITLHPEKFEENSLEVQNIKLKHETGYDNNDAYKCPYCHRKFKKRRNINRHLKTRHPEKSVAPGVDVAKIGLNLLGNQAEKTEAIDEDMPNYDDYDAFIAKWKEVLECDLCKKSFSNFGLLRKHYKVEHPSDKCHVICCEYKIPSRIRLVEHIRFHLDPNSFKCTTCEKCLPNSIALNLHMQIHDDKKPYQCNVCEKSFRKRDKLLLHSGRHSSETNYFCSVCDKGFPTKLLLKNHGYIHTRNIKYHCDHCGKFYYSALELEEHTLQHTDIENSNSKWPCDLCSAAYNSHIALNQHKKSCHSDAAYICSECGKKCLSKLYLNLHKKRVHGIIDTFKCTICNKELMSARTLHYHKATHDGNAEYQCPHCSLKLKHKKNIPRHIQIAHHEEYNEMKKRKRTSKKVN